MFEILLTPEGTQVVAVCNRCIAEGAEDANCAIEAATLAFVQALRSEGHVASVSDPGDVDPFRA